MREKGPSSSVGIHYLTGINSCLLHSWSTPALGTVICKAVKPSPPCPDGVLRPEVGREAGTRGFSLQGQTLAELRSWKPSFLTRRLLLSACQDPGCASGVHSFLSLSPSSSLST